jgi:alkanesulfonate monooxygenase SsuD/methylene tetrahydromethanopterin reductase-like flavin-dependent oxidoreductase (luciferase family)
MQRSNSLPKVKRLRKSSYDEITRPGISFGVHLPSRLLANEGGFQAVSDALLMSIVDAAKTAGLSSLWVTDHIVYSDPWMDCMLLLAAVAGRAGKHGLTIGTGIVVLPLRHPVALAQSFATLDILTSGKLIIGLGEGSTQSDFDALGIPFQTRGQMLEDGVKALRALLSRTSVTHNGPYYYFKDITVSPRCIQRPYPPIWLSSWGSPIGMRRVARLGDGWVASALRSTPEEFSRALGTLNSALTALGKDPGTFPNVVDTMFMFIDSDGDRARQIAVPIIERTIRSSFDESSGHYLVGDYQECEALLRRWIKAGAKQLCVWPVADTVQQIKRFGEYILPEL